MKSMHVKFVLTAIALSIASASFAETAATTTAATTTTTTTTAATTTPATTTSKSKTKHVAHHKKAHGFYVQLGSFSNKSNAEHLKETAKTKTHYPVRMYQFKKYYVVKVGPMHTASEMMKVKEELNLAPHETKRPELPTVMHTHPKKIDIYQGATPPVYKPVVAAASSQNNPYVAAYVGASKPTIDSHMTVDNGSSYPPPYNVDNYSTNTQTKASAALEAGYRFKRDNQWIPAYSIGARYQHLFSNDLGNKVTQYSMSEFTNYTYQWNLVSDVIVILGKADLAEWHHFMPYVTGGAGVTFNRTTHYNETPLAGVTPRLNPGFNDNTITRFTWQVGAGLDWQIQPKVIVSLDYAYQNLGKVVSGPGAGSWSGTRLSSGKYNTNTVMLGANYLFN